MIVKELLKAHLLKVTTDKIGNPVNSDQTALQSTFSESRESAMTIKREAYTPKLGRQRLRRTPSSGETVPIQTQGKAEEAREKFLKRMIIKMDLVD